MPEQLNLMGCGKCRGPRSFYQKGVEAYCSKCNTFLGIAGPIKILVKYKEKLLTNKEK